MHEALDGIEPFDEFGGICLEVGHDVGDVPDNGGVDRHANDDPKKDVESFGTGDGNHVANDHHHQRGEGPVEGSNIQLPQIAPTVGSGELAILNLTLNPGPTPKTCRICIGPIHNGNSATTSCIGGAQGPIILPSGKGKEAAGSPMGHQNDTE